jgi:hypothetical protein
VNEDRGALELTKPLHRSIPGCLDDARGTVNAVDARRNIECRRNTRRDHQSAIAEPPGNKKRPAFSGGGDSHAAQELWFVGE